MLDENAEILFDGAKVTPRTPLAAKEIKNLHSFLKPLDNKEERCYFIENGVENLPDFYKKFYLNDCNLKRFAEIKAFCKQSGLSPTAVGLLKLIKNELSPVALIGGKTQELLKDSLSVFGANR